jgi:sarcosine oxidase, subunit beta
MNSPPDAVVIGAGIVGASCAAHLAERGLAVVQLEQSEAPALHSTGKSAAGVRAQFGTSTNVLLSKESIEEYAAMDDSGYRAVGYLMIVPETHWAAHQEGIELQRSHGVPSTALTPDEAQAIVPFNVDGIAGCSFSPTDGVVDPHGITHHYLRSARRLGAEIHLSTKLLSGHRDGGTWKLATSRGTIDTPIVVNAAGCWSGEVAASAGLHVPVSPARRHVFGSAPFDEVRNVPMTFDLASGVWLRSEGDRIIIGKADPSDGGWRDSMNWDWLEPTMTDFVHRFPWGDRLGLDHKASWWGYYEVTPDHFPIIGTMPETSGWLNACGFSGHGVMQAAAVGRVVAQEAVGEVPSINIDQLRIERFSDPNHRSSDIHL